MDLAVFVTLPPRKADRFARIGFGIYGGGRIFYTLRKPDRFARLCFGISGPGRTPEPEPLRSGPEPGQNRPQELHFEHFCVQARNLARIGLRSFILSISGLRPGTWPE